MQSGSQEPAVFSAAHQSGGAHSLRRTKATLIYRKTGNLRAVQLLLGHTKLESTVRYLGVEVDDAIAISKTLICSGGAGHSVTIAVTAECRRFQSAASFIERDFRHHPC